MTDYIIHRNDELYHFGVRGQKWGVRRYQNEDGSYKSGAEGRYAQSTISGKVKNVSISGPARSAAPSGKTPQKVSGRDFHSAKGMNDVNDGSGKGRQQNETSRTNSSSGGGSGNKNSDLSSVVEKITGQKITVYDVSEKKAQTEKGSGKKSSEKKKTEKEFKVSELQSKISELISDIESDEEWEKLQLSDDDKKSLEDLIEKYRAYKQVNSTSTKKTRKIDDFIDRYEKWKNKNKVEHMESSDYIIHRNDELYHFGVKGMKWGVRRYQNEDGSYKSGAEGRYEPDNSSGHTLKNRVKSSLGIYKDGDENPYVSNRRRKNRKAEEEESSSGHTLKNRVKSSLGIYKDGDENPYVSESRRKNRKDEAAQAEKAAKKQAQQQKNDEKAAKNSYKKIAGKYLLRNIGTGIASNIAGNAVSKLTGNEYAGLYTNAGLQTAAGVANLIRSGREAKQLYDYRKRNRAQHSDLLSAYDELYHGEDGVIYGIKRS